MNPNNYDPTISVEEGNRISKYFDERVTDNFSSFWIYLGIFTIITGFVLTPIMKAPDNMFSIMNYISSSFCNIFKKKTVSEKDLQDLTTNLVSENIIEKFDSQKVARKKSEEMFNELEIISAKSQVSEKFFQENNEDKKNGKELKDLNNPTENETLPQESFKEALFNPKFTILMISMSIIFGTITCNNINYKSIGLAMYDDRTLTSFGIVSTISTCLGRLFGGYLIDKLGLKNAMKCLLATMTVALFFLQFFRNYLLVFFSCYAIIAFCTGFILTTFNCAIIIVYGVELGAKLQSFLGIMPLLNGLITQLYDRYVLSQFGYTTYIYIEITVCVFYILVMDQLGWVNYKAN